MKDLQREILNQVASGEISASEGAARLESLREPEPAQLPPAPATAPVATAARLVKVTSQFGSAEIIGDPSVTFAVAEGPHVARQDGDTMVIDHSPLNDDRSFSFETGRRVVVNGFDFNRRPLIVRMNPSLALQLSVQAGNIRIEGVHGPISGDVQAGNCRVNDFRSPLNLSLQAGNITAAGRLDGGASKVRCEMGAVRIGLVKGSSVRVTAKSSLGKVAIEGESGVAVGQSGREVTIGSGAGTLDVECTMGSIRVGVE